MDGRATNGTGSIGPCGINCSNNEEIYAFHPGGANFLVADGSVHFIRQTITMRALARLVTPFGGELASPADF